MKRIKKWLNWKKFWEVHGWIQLVLFLLFVMAGNTHMAYTSVLASMAFFGIAECKKDDD